MNFNTFITLFENKKKHGGVDDFIVSRIKTKYVPLEEKQARANLIVENTMFEKDDKGNKNFHVNSVAYHMFVFLTLVDMYTDVEINYKESLAQYNKLKESECFDFIIPRINKDDMAEFKLVLESMRNDVITNECNICTYIDKQIRRISKLAVSALSPIVENIDIDKLNEVMNELNIKKP